MYLLCSTLSVLLLTSLETIAQGAFILAGSADAGDSLTDLTPDTTMQCIAAHLSAYPTENDTFDIDGDGQPDIYFVTNGDAGLGGGSAGCGVYAAGGHAAIAVRSDTGVICCPTYVPLTVADTFNFGDTINSNLRYGGSALIMSESWGGSTAPGFSKWTNIGPKYIGIRLSLSFDTLYGWVQVSATQSGPLQLFTLTVFDFAVNRNTHIGIDEQQLSVITAYPTVSRDIHRIWLPPAIPRASYSVTDVSGRVAASGTFVSGDNVIDGSRWPAGTYLMVINYNNHCRTIRLMHE